MTLHEAFALADEAERQLLWGEFAQASKVLAAEVRAQRGHGSL